MKSKTVLMLIIYTFFGCSFSKKYQAPTGATIKKSLDIKNGEHLFVLDQSIADLGEAWIDESGMLWGDVIKNIDGSIRYLNHEEASEYCKNLGTILPSEDDYIRLRIYMGAKSDLYEGYKPQVLPNLLRVVNGKEFSNFFWTSTTQLLHYHLAYVFGSKIGGFGIVNREFADDFTSARCVKQL
jgi:hypothetical protein